MITNLTAHVMKTISLCCLFIRKLQGPRSNFEIGGGGGGDTVSDSILGGHKTLFLTSYILGGHKTSSDTH